MFTQTDAPLHFPLINDYLNSGESGGNPGAGFWFVVSPRYEATDK